MDINEQLKKIRQSINVVQAKVAFQKEAAEALQVAVEDLGHDFDGFIEVFDAVQRDHQERFSRYEERFARLEKHVGL